MYQAHWGLRTSPFRSEGDELHFYPSPSHDEALARMHFLVSHRRHLGLLLGDVGMGKSFMLQVLTSQLRRQGQNVLLTSALGQDTYELLWQLAAALACNPREGIGAAALWQRVTHGLEQTSLVRGHLTVLVDDVDAASSEVETTVLRLLQLSQRYQGAVTTLLAANQKNYRRLDARLLDLAELRIELEPFTPADTRSFIGQSLQRAGAMPNIFAEQALQRIHATSHGIPRKVVQLADLALLAAAGQQRQQIDGHTVETVHQELCI